MFDISDNRPLSQTQLNVSVPCIRAMVNDGTYLVSGGPIMNLDIFRTKFPIFLSYDFCPCFHDLHLTGFVDKN